MRTKNEILAETKKVEQAKKNAERKVERCVERLAELADELQEAGSDDNDCYIPNAVIRYFDNKTTNI